MINLNTVILIGRLTKDPELKYTPAGKAVANFTLAVSRPFKNQNGEQEADFIPIVVWNKTAENCATYISKGSQVAIDGRMQVRTYDDKEGQRRWVTEVISNSVKFLDSKKSVENINKTVDNKIGEEISFNQEDIPF